jgi:hypothetical protein
MKFKVEFVGVNPEGQEVTDLRTEIIDTDVEDRFWKVRKPKQMKVWFENAANHPWAQEQRGYTNVVKKVTVL